jgi:energy-coupling factor transport system ATP-binding protein
MTTHMNTVAKIDHVSFWYGAQDTSQSSYYTSPSDEHPELGTPADARTDTPTLDDLTITIVPGTLTLLCGASGSGKTSALQLLNGLVPHFHHGTLSGNVRVADLDVGSADIGRCGEVSATVFQNPKTQFFTSAVRSELAFRMENHGVPRPQMLAAVDSTARECNIENLMDRKLGEMSGGELQKVACAQAISAHTPLLLFDEPTSNLSVDAIEEFSKMLLHLKKQGRTIVIAEHRLYFLRGIVDQAIVLKDGRIDHQISGTEFFAQSDQDRRDKGLRTLKRPVMNINTASDRSPRSEPVSASHQSGLQLDNLRFSYGKRPVLAIKHATFPKGKISALVGVNGAGKTTLARLICGLVKEERHSKISFNGQTLSAQQRTDMSYIVMQDVHRQLFADSVRKEVTLGYNTADKRKTEVLSVLKTLDLETFADRHPLSLSGGQKQRLVIASAIACEKQIYIFDEPTSGVDYSHLMAISKSLRALAHEGAVVIVITHDTELLQTCADQIVHLRPLQDVSNDKDQLYVESLT